MVTIYFNGNLLEPLFKALMGGSVSACTCGVPQIQTDLPGFETKKEKQTFHSINAHLSSSNRILGKFGFSERTSYLIRTT